MEKLKQKRRFYERGRRREDDIKHGINTIGQQDVDWIKWLFIHCFEHCKQPSVLIKSFSFRLIYSYIYIQISLRKTRFIAANR